MKKSPVKVKMVKGKKPTRKTAPAKVKKMKGKKA